jgi:hypothetical protein
MKKSRFTATQIISLLKQQEAGVKVKDICREHGNNCHDDPQYSHGLRLVLILYDVTPYYPLL